MLSESAHTLELCGYKKYINTSLTCWLGIKKGKRVWILELNLKFSFLLLLFLFLPNCASTQKTVVMGIRMHISKLENNYKNGKYLLGMYLQKNKKMIK